MKKCEEALARILARLAERYGQPIDVTDLAAVVAEMTELPGPPAK